MDAHEHQERRLIREPSETGRPASAKRRWWGTTSLNLAARQPVSHAIMFYLLTAAALIIFAPCVIVPIWRDVQKLGESERSLRVLVLQLQDQVEKNKVRIDALKNDPLVIERVARRELNRRTSSTSAGAPPNWRPFA